MQPENWIESGNGDAAHMTDGTWACVLIASSDELSMCFVSLQLCKIIIVEEAWKVRT
jgi:hypothetical protein